ncbi:hypothetical protein [Victivallis sp. Marseille-Q1083]|uniref:hypothetical protein n=1 Tax=Victivallis sp. Marseille-Q1083 TaxID=2717288 RepID=UPI00158DCE34|nr:hypothetical protein [Victivallis sp. Marseille-Q1083]
MMHYKTRRGMVLELEQDGIAYAFHQAESPWRGRWLWRVDAGPAEYIELRGKADCYSGGAKDMQLQVSYQVCDGGLECRVQLTNAALLVGHRVDLLRWQVGVDCLMLSYPEFLDKFSPSGARVENSHFWCALATPSGKRLAVVSPDRVAGWRGLYDDRRAGYSRGDRPSGGHQIGTIAVDLLNAGEKLPVRVTPPPVELAPGEQREWRFYLIPCRSEPEMWARTAEYTRAACVAFAASGNEPGRLAGGRIFAPAGETLTIRYPEEKSLTADEIRIDGENSWIGRAQPTEIAAVAVRDFALRLPARNEFGNSYQFSIECGARTTTGSIYSWADWTRYLLSAASYAKSRPPRGTHVMEAYMPVLAWIAAEKIDPLPTRRARIESFFEEELFNCSYTPDGEPLCFPHRIQNHAFVIDLCREMYGLDGDLKWRRRADRLVTYLLGCRGADGGLYAHHGRQHYTSVIYPARSLYEYAESLRADEPKRAAEIIDALRPVFADLLCRRDNIGTEGAPCYEDGAIACTAQQLAFWAWKEKAPEYLPAAEAVMRGHDCVEWRGPDATTHGASVRFWETFWAIGWRNCLNTPHGWSAWTGEAYYFLYLASGKLEYWRKFLMNLTACLHLFELRSSTLYFCYSPESVIFDGVDRQWSGERYLEMAPTPGNWEEGGCESHEITKMIQDFLLYSAYVWEEDGKVRALNATVEAGGKVVAANARIKQVYVNRSVQKNLTAALPLIYHGNPAGEGK